MLGRLSPSHPPAGPRNWLRSGKLLAVLMLGCGGPAPPRPTSTPSPPPPKPPPITRNDPPKPLADEPCPFRFEEVREGSGVKFVHVSGMNAQKLFPTANGSGLAIFDHDGDGRLDLYFASGNTLPLADRPEASNRLYRNLGGWKFEDVTERSGLGFRGYCHGITVGDLDNDGDPDLFLSNYGGDVLYQNNGDGTFHDISRSAGVFRQDTWSSGSAFLDIDHDGDLDLYVSRYGDWRFPRDDRFCGDPLKKIRRYCSPKELSTVPHTLFRNNGDGSFTDVSEAAGLAGAEGHGFAAVAADLNGDGHADLYVANDQDPNFLYLGNGKGGFRDASTESGAAFDGEGRTQSGMGADAEDLDGDGLPELFVTNFQEEYNTVYKSLGPATFFDATAEFGLAVESLPWIGWGCALADLDNDGWPDLVVANAHIDDNADVPGQPGEYAQPPLLHQNRDGKAFRSASRGAGTYFNTPRLGHGLAFGDLDDDGDLDLVVSHKDGPPALLRNDSSAASTNHWVRFALRGTRGNRDGVGARVEVLAGGRTIHRLVKSGQGLMSSHDPRLLVGVGQADQVERVTVRWPSGALTVLENLEPGRTYQAVEPEGPRQ